MTAAAGIALFVMCGAGTILIAAELPWFDRRPTVDRLRPYTRGGVTVPNTSSESFRQVIVPIAQSVGARISRALGVTEDLGARLDRAGEPLSTGEFRLRQMTRGMLAFLGAVVVVLWRSLPWAVAISLLIAAPTLTVLAEEQRLASRGERRRRRLEAELPVVVEQMGMLLSAGYSVTGALARLSVRTNGVASDDLRRVIRRIRHGRSENDALAEWAEEAGLESVRRLVAVLSMHGTTGDLGSLISEEARSIRADAHRDLLEVIERRAQLVWIPVTVATLVPGLIFLAVPFISAMSQVTGT